MPLLASPIRESCDTSSAAACCCRWSFTHSGERIKKQEFADCLPRASIQDLGVILMGAGYEVIDTSRTLSAPISVLASLAFALGVCV